MYGIATAKTNDTARRTTDSNARSIVIDPRLSSLWSAGHRTAAHCCTSPAVLVTSMVPT
jgi:hypothetical protein